jgi:TPR repeat protein
MSSAKRARDEPPPPSNPFFLGCLLLYHAQQQVQRCLNPKVELTLPPISTIACFATLAITTKLRQSMLACGRFQHLLLYRFSCHHLPLKLKRQMRAIALRTVQKFVVVWSKQMVEEAKRLQLSGQCAKALACYTLAWTLGSLPSGAEIANMLLDGRAGVSANPQIARAFAAEASQREDPGGYGMLALWLMNDETTKKADPYFEQARQTILEVPNSPHDPFINMAWGTFFDYRQIPQWVKHDWRDDQYEARTCYEVSAQSGIDRGQYSFAIKLMMMDYKPLHNKAFQLCMSSAEQGFRPAMIQIGNFFLNGWGVDVDLHAAKRWYELASAAGCNCKEELANLAKLLSVVEMADK